ncbi:MAG: hypothetical protein M3N98_07745 [Actinomycetota bacterium]|nr:hypothetical protein [Actinomycetota bacterium]
MSEEKAKVKEAVGFATGDRRVEAEGRAQREAESSPEPSSTGKEPTEGEVDEVEDDVRADHGDI